MKWTEQHINSLFKNWKKKYLKNINNILKKLIKNKNSSHRGKKQILVLFTCKSLAYAIAAYWTK
jgi:hypothetical protein